MTRINVYEYEVPFDDEQHTQVPSDEHEFDESDEALHPDQRIFAVGERTRALIYTRFGGDFDTALLHADRICHTFSKPPAWALELHDMHMTDLGLRCKHRGINA